MILAPAGFGCLMAANGQMSSWSRRTDVILEPSETLRGASADLVAWFYQLRHSGDWHHRDAVGRRVNGSAFTEYGSSGSVHYRLCLRVVAMGGKNGVPIAQ